MAAAPGLRGPGCGASGRLADRPQVIVALFASENPTDRGSLSGRDRGHDDRLGKRPDMGCLSELHRSLVRHPGCQFHVDRYHRDGSVLLDRLAIHIKRFAQDTSVLVKSALPGLRPPARRRHAFGARNDLPHLPVSIIHETFTDRQWLELREPLSTCAEDLLQFVGRPTNHQHPMVDAFGSSFEPDGRYVARYPARSIVQAESGGSLLDAASPAVPDIRERFQTAHDHEDHRHGIRQKPQRDEARSNRSNKPENEPVLFVERMRENTIGAIVVVKVVWCWLVLFERYPGCGLPGLKIELRHIRRFHRNTLPCDPIKTLFEFVEFFSRPTFPCPFCAADGPHRRRSSRQRTDTVARNAGISGDQDKPFGLGLGNQ